MDINRPATTSSGGGFTMGNVNPNTMMTVLIALVVIILVILLFQSSSPTNVAAAGYVNPLNATMRTNPFINTPQRNML
ncbi:ODV-E18 [Agrotis segetum nucleopolyhedrovirus A]|uniref:ODV-E18 n=1 Tax=Agrotis segetum nuclear polyhedrosis virus TaxID=1962501 RepID=Q287C2_NPVAS|nr:ODV-E18 [Agrotis segetum nucleopolyhedrovirus A]AAZ38316.1 ODV-E18 [Agrotis segetum nucleopolyhedrovirus A]